MSFAIRGRCLAICAVMLTGCVPPPTRAERAAAAAEARPEALRQQAREFRDAQVGKCMGPHATEVLSTADYKAMLDACDRQTPQYVATEGDRERETQEEVEICAHALELPDSTDEDKREYCRRNVVVGPDVIPARSTTAGAGAQAVP